MEREMNLPFDASFATTFLNSQANAQYGNGNLTGYLQTGATVVNKILTGPCEWYAQNNINYDVGAIRFKVATTVSGIPAANSLVFSMCSAGAAFDAIFLTLRNDGILELMISDDSSIPVGVYDIFSWTPVANEVMELELDYDFNIGVGRLYWGPEGGKATKMGVDIALPVFAKTRPYYKFSLARDFINDISFPIFKFQDFIIFPTQKHTTEVDYTILSNYIPDVYPPLALPTSIVYGRTLYNNLPVSGAKITFIPVKGTYINQGDIGNFSLVATSDAQGYFEIDIPYLGGAKASYTCTYTVGSVTITKTGTLVIPTDKFLVIS